MTAPGSSSGCSVDPEVELEEMCVEPDADERQGNQSESDRQCARSPRRAARDEGCDRDEAPSEQCGADRGPRLDGADRAPAEHRCDFEGERPEPGRQEPPGKQEIHSAPLDEKPHCRQDRDDRGGHSNGRVQRDARVRQRIAVEPARGREQQRRRSRARTRARARRSARNDTSRGVRVALPSNRQADSCR